MFEELKNKVADWFIAHEDKKKAKAQNAPASAPKRPSARQARLALADQTHAALDQAMKDKNLQKERYANMSDERKALIAQAQAIRRSKAQIIEDLDDEAKLKLYAMAMKALLNEEISEPIDLVDKPPRKKKP